MPPDNQSHLALKSKRQQSEVKMSGINACLMNVENWYLMAGVETNRGTEYEIGHILLRRRLESLGTIINKNGYYEAEHPNHALTKHGMKKWLEILKELGINRKTMKRKRRMTHEEFLRIHKIRFKKYLALKEANGQKCECK